MVMTHDDKNSDHGKTTNTKVVMKSHTAKMMIVSRVVSNLLKGICCVDVFTAQ